MYQAGHRMLTGARGAAQNAWQLAQARVATAHVP
eukprot:CAMPEP_0119378038 /NCGR_PEP_ID=MMETSP1334-20130426/47366_1 /TAXON_ID=127549 /ORGANISM="Calcidiscus leptoporus, Strain RCC1130" /LENGTH=33 /DNA_ID= /DNA_START= /DNA_END= /DNA_ORIENTATION=